MQQNFIHDILDSTWTKCIAVSERSTVQIRIGLSSKYNIWNTRKTIAASTLNKTSDNTIICMFLFVKLLFEMATAHIQQHWFSTQEWVFLKNIYILRQQVSEPRGTWTPNLSIHAACSTIWDTRTRHIITYVLEHWVWRYIYFSCEVSFGNVIYAQAAAFIFDRLTDAF